MYIHDFFKNLTLLNKENMPNLDKYPTTDVIYYGYCKKEDIPLDKLNTVENGVNYLVYSPLENTKDINYIMVDEEFKYIELLNNESPNYKRQSLIKRDAAFIEGIWLFDELACLEQNPFFDADISMGYQALQIYYNLIETDTPLLHLFNNIPIKRDIFFAQFHYFVKRYIKHKLGFGSNKITTQALSTYQNNLHNAIIRYDKLCPNYSEISSITYKDNAEFETIIHQLHTLDYYYAIDTVKKLDN